ncbi:GNAT family N-acetyltransferase [Candidatus Riflebacteria bacterium]
MKITLRKPESSDSEEFLLRVKNSRALHRPWVYPPDTQQKYSEYLKRIQKETHAGFLICRAEDDAITGVVNINEIVFRNFKSGYLGFYAFVPYAKLGFMSVGLKKVSDHAFRKIGLHRLEANIQPANKRSIKLVERLGFYKEGLSKDYLKIGGRWRDHERWALVKKV